MKAHHRLINRRNNEKMWSKINIADMTEMYPISLFRNSVHYEIPLRVSTSFILSGENYIFESAVRGYNDSRS